MVEWLYDEIVLVGDAVARNGWKGLRSKSPEASALSALLQSGLLHPGVDLPSDFRSPGSIQRKSFDLISASASYTGVPTKGGKRTAAVVAAFESDPSRMHAKAIAIRKLLASGNVPPSSDEAEWDVRVAAHEGGVIERLARQRERDPNLRKLKLNAVARSGGVLACEACGFDFEATYGDRGAGYIHVHHINPLHITGAVETGLDDLALVCANCHAMCHRGPWITPTQVAALIAAQ